MPDERLNEIADQLDSIGELLREISYDRLSEAVANETNTKPESLKPIAAAVRAIEKAARSLRI